MSVDQKRWIVAVILPESSEPMLHMISCGAEHTAQEVGATFCHSMVGLPNEAHVGVFPAEEFIANLREHGEEDLAQQVEDTFDNNPQPPSEFEIT